MPVMEGTSRLKTAQAEYDFAVDGGAVSTITLRGIGINGGELPDDSVITGGYLEVDTVPTSGGLAEISVDSEGTGDVVAGAVISGAPWSTTGRKDLIPDFTGSATVKTTAKRSLAITITVAALTAGKFRVVVFYK